MMNKKVILIIIISALAIGAGTIVLLKTLESNNSNPQPAAQPNTQEDDKENTDYIEKADALAKEGLELMLTEPQKAHDKFIEAKKAYTEAGDEAKASEMETNALTAKAHYTLDPEYPSSTEGTGGDSSETAKASSESADFVDID